MKKGLVQEINRQHVSRRRWRKFWSMMAAAAAFCTTYVLILPAITMSRQLVCGKEEHTHIEQCYERQPIAVCGLEIGESHTHTDACCTQETVWICGLEETEGHSHIESCYESQTVNICGLEETEGHSHTESCYEKQWVNTCGQEESESHAHSESCQEEQSALVCGQEEAQPHAHTEECFSQERQLICGQEEKQPHTHSEACSGVENVLSCTLPETVEGHTHSDSCYALQDVLVCALEEHTHNEFCYDVGPADANADVETREDWEKAFSDIELTGRREEDIPAVALTQLGYRESSRNYVIVDEWILNGYTRYGAWYGDPYGDWDAMFASFVLHYAGVDELGMEQDPNAWAGKIAGETPERYKTADVYQPGIGDLVFFDRDVDGEIDGVGILLEIQEDAWRIIEGNTEDAVALVNYAPGDSRIVSYGIVADPEQGTGGDGSAETTEYTVTYLANNGTEETGAFRGSGEVALSWEGFTAPEGMILSAWNTAADGTGTNYPDGEKLTLTEDVTLYAQWVPGYTVTYMANNGTEETGRFKGSGEVALTWEGFTAPEGKVLISWNTAPDGTGTNYDDGEPLELTEDLTLYAQWIEKAALNSFFTTLEEPRAAGSITLKKQIEWTGKNADDYSYRLHLTLDGSTLNAGSTTTVTPTKERHIGILLDVTETMMSTWVGSTKGQNKFDAVRDLLQGANGTDGFLGSILDGNTQVSIIIVKGMAGGGSYTSLYDVIASGKEPGDFSNINNSQHINHGISYVTGLLAAEDFFGKGPDSIDSLVYIVGNGPDTYVKYSNGMNQMGTNGSKAQTENYNDYVTFMGNHPNLSMYMVGVAGQGGELERGSETAQKMGQFSVNRGTGGGYFEADDEEQLKNHLTNIAQTITVKPDKVTGITVSDPLSGNVTLADTPNLTATLTMLDSEGNPKPDTTENPNPVHITNQKSDENTPQVYIEGGVLTCKYPTEISGPFKLEIGFNIQTAEGKYQPATGENYPNTGETGTDWGANISAGKPGYFSNGDATATYTLNNTTSTGVAFPKPVVQAPPKATITVKKAWDKNTADEDKKAVTVTLHRGSADGETVGEVVLNKENGWEEKCDVKVLTAEGANNLIVPVEQAVDGFTTTYEPGNVSVTKNGEVTITVTNTKKEVKKTAALTVTKKWQNVSGTASATIHVCTKDGVNYTELEGSPFTVNNGTEGSKTFTVTWTGETPPELCIYEESDKAFYPVITGDGKAKTVTVSDKPLSAMEFTNIVDKGTYTVTLTNMASVQMPETGGPGTYGYVFGGLVLMLGAVLLMQIRKKTERGGNGSTFG